MDKELLSVIKKQSNVDDDLLVERVYYETGQDVGATVLKLCNIEYPEPKTKIRNVFDDVREICDDKDNNYLSQ